MGINFPRLKYECPIFCLCGLELSGFKAFVTQNWVGIISERCECGMEGSSCSIPRNRDYSQKSKIRYTIFLTTLSRARTSNTV